jgi:hypothetical protein
MQMLLKEVLYVGSNGVLYRVVEMFVLLQYCSSRQRVMFTLWCYRHAVGTNGGTGLGRMWEECDLGGVRHYYRMQADWRVFHHTVQ